MFHELQCVIDGVIRKLGYVQISYSDCKYLLFQPSSIAFGARDGRHTVFDIRSHRFTGGFAISSFHIIDDPLKGLMKNTGSSSSVKFQLKILFSGAVKNDFANVLA